MEDFLETLTLKLYITANNIDAKFYRQVLCHIDL